MALLTKENLHWQSTAREVAEEVIRPKAAHYDREQVYPWEIKDAMAYLAEKGYDPGFGARPLKRVIQQEIENPLSMAILKGEFKEGSTINFIKNNNGAGLNIVSPAVIH